jgi:hypothetical protein
VIPRRGAPPSKSRIRGVTRVITVASGKGGVGKSTVAGGSFAQQVDEAYISESGFESTANEWRESRANSENRSTGSRYLWAIRTEIDGVGGA